MQLGRRSLSRDALMRRTLVAGALFNFVAAAMVLLPGSLGRLADLPPSAPRLYSWLLALFIVLFGGVYAWLSRRRVIDRPLVAMAIVGKFGVFFVALVCLLLGDISSKAFAPAVGDLGFGLVFLWWLNGAPSPQS